jgi:DNA polymerase I-like protein with 3'-5' exonuclease and polymerase domains
MSNKASEFFKAYSEMTLREKDLGFYEKREFNKDGSLRKTTGTLQYVIPDRPDGSGVVHHRLNHCSTTTGRLSASNPNMQQVPRDSKVKEMFRSHYGPDGWIAQCDYSAMEVVMGCVLTGDKKLLSLLESGTDMHCYRLAFQEGMPYEEVYELCHNPDAPNPKEWKKKRTAIKTFSFAAQYGASAKGLAFASGASLKDAEKFLANEEALFPESIKYRDVIAAEVNRTALLEPIRREQSDDGSWRIYREGYFTAPCGTRYRFRQKPVWREGKQVMDFKPTEMANYPFQGSGSLLMLIAMGMIMRAGLACNWMDGKFKLMNTVHDAAYLSCADEETAKEAAALLKRCMEGARDRMLALWPDFGILKDVQFPAEGGVGKSLKEEYTI